MPNRPLFFGPLLHLRSIPALDRLTSAELGAIAQHAEEEVFAAGAPLFRAESAREAFYVVVDGRVGVARRGGAVEEIGPGEAVGFYHLLARSADPLEATALWDTITLRVDWDAHLDACEQHFSILAAHLEFLAASCQEELDVARRRNPSDIASPDESARDHVVSEAETGSDARSEMDLVQRLQALHRCPAFPSSNMDALAELARHLEEIRLAPGGTLWSAGDASDSMILVAAGHLERTGEGWREEFGPGDVAGRFEALAGLPRRSPLRALAPSVVLRARMEALLDILEDHFTMAVDFMAEVAGELLRLRDGSGPASWPRE